MMTPRKLIAETRAVPPAAIAAAELRELKMRGGERVPATVQVHLRRSGGLAFQVTLRDVSERGCKVELVETPSIGESVWLKFGGLESVEAIVRWVVGSTGGIQFLRPIHPAVFAALALRIGIPRARPAA